MLREWKPVIKQVITFLLLLILITISITLLLFPDKKPDLVLNLFSEMIGTVLSIFCIDQLLKIREESHRLPTRYLWYSRLFDLIEDLLIKTLPEQYLKPSNKIYHYTRADLFVIPRLEIAKVVESEELVSQILQGFEKNDYSSFFNQLLRVKERLNNIVERSSSFFKEGEMILILNFERSLDRVLETDFNPNDAASWRESAIALSIVISHAIKIELWLREVIIDSFTLVSSNHNNLP